MPVEERSLTSGMLLEETNSPEIGICLSTPLRTRRSQKELYLSAKMVMFSESRPRRNRIIVCQRVKPVGEPCAGKPHARFDEREVETEHGEASEAPATERAGNRPSQHLNHRATSRLYPF